MKLTLVWVLAVLVGVCIMKQDETGIGVGACCVSGCLHHETG